MSTSKQYVADFETITDKCMRDHNLKETYVWACGIMDIETMEFEHYNNIADFLRFFAKKNSTCYFHNLRFDGRFIVDYLLKHDFIVTKGQKKEKKTMTFSNVIDDMGNWYAIEIIFDANKKKPKKLTLLDSAKKIPLQVKVIAKAYNVEKLKGEINYDLFRSRNHVMTNEEYDYLYNDCFIVASALRQHFDMGLNRMTISSDAMKMFKSSLDEDPKRSQQFFDELFPEVDIQMDKFIRDSYKGGYTYVNPKYKNKRLKGVTYDVNSLYPSCMLNYPLPYSKPIGEGIYQRLIPQVKAQYDLYIVSMEIQSFSLKEGYVPIIQIKNDPNFNPRQYLSTNEDKFGDERTVYLTLTNIDYDMIKEFYHLEGVKITGKVYFKSMTGIFDKYISIWREVKEKSEGGKRQVAKLMLNSLY